MPTYGSRVTAAIHLTGDIAPEVRFYSAEEASSGRDYAVVGVTGDLNLFVNEPGQAQALADAFADVADHFGTDPIRTYVLRRAREAVAEFRAWLQTPATGGELVWCENPDHPQEGEPHAPRDDCKYPHNSGRHADQHSRDLRYAEFAGRLATLLDELTDTPEVPANPTPDGRPLFNATRDQLDKLVAAGDADAIAEDQHRRGDAR